MTDVGRCWHLAIETSNPSAEGPGVGPSVAVRTVDDGVVAVEPLAPTGRHDDDLMPAIERVCARLGLMPEGLERVSVSVGPGGYTGIRVAVVTAQAMAEVSGAAMAAVPTADAVAHAARTAGDVDGRFAVCLASKRHAAFVTCFEGAGTGAVVGVVEAEVLSTLGVRWLIADRFLPSAFAEAAAGLGMGVIEPRFDAAAVLACGESASVVRGDPLLPVYPREPEAVRKWRERPSPRNRD